MRQLGIRGGVDSTTRNTIDKLVIGNLEIEDSVQLLAALSEHLVELGNRAVGIQSIPSQPG